MKLYKEINDFIDEPHNKVTPWIKRLNKWVKQNHQKYSYHVVMPLETSHVGTTGVLIAYSPKHSKGYSM